MHCRPVYQTKVLGLLISLDVTQNTALTELRCYNNQLSSLDVSQNTALTHLICPFNKLSNLERITGNLVIKDSHVLDTLKGFLESNYEDFKNEN